MTDLSKKHIEYAKLHNANIPDKSHLRFPMSIRVDENYFIDRINDTGSNVSVTCGGNYEDWSIEELSNDVLIEIGDGLTEIINDLSELEIESD